MKKQNSKLPYLLALSYTQNVHNIEYATKLFKNNFPLGKIEQVKIDGFDALQCNIYDKDNTTIVSGEYIILDI